MDVVNLLLAIIAIASALTPLVVSVTEMLKLLVKGIAPPGIKSELVPTISCFVGLALAMAILGFRADSDLRSIAIGGFVAGLIASKLFDVGQARAGVSTTTTVSTVAQTDATPTTAARTASTYTETTVETAPTAAGPPA